MKRFIVLSFFCFVFVSHKSQLNPYYQSIDITLSGDLLKQELSNLVINTHLNLLQYTSSSTNDTWDLIKSSDSYLADTSKVYLIYGFNDNDSDLENDLTRAKSLSCHGNDCNGLWNREHIFPKSLANPEMNTNYPGTGTDVHNLRSCDYGTNSTRGNLKFIDGNGSAGMSNNYWYPGDQWKGDVARIIMYMALRYPNQCDALNVGDGPSQYAPNADIPDIFLEWNASDPVSIFEENRNEVIFTAQGNRNPFIDNPYLATQIWNGPEAENKWLDVKIKNLEFDKSYVLAPNPASKTAKVFSKRAITKLILYNLSGEIVIDQIGNCLELEGLCPGIYLLNIYDDREGYAVVKKLIKY